MHVAIRDKQEIDVCVVGDGERDRDRDRERERETRRVPVALERDVPAATEQIDRVLLPTSLHNTAYLMTMPTYRHGYLTHHLAVTDLLHC